MTSMPDDDAIRRLVARLARPDGSGGRTIERAALLAAGADFSAVMTWIRAHGGAPEAPAARLPHGLYGARESLAEPMPLRYILPGGALEQAPPAPIQGREAS
jgi:hypothetical protein